MTATEPQLLTVGTGERERRIATIVEKGSADRRPGLIWLPGLKSDMVSTKAAALAEWSRERGLAMTRLDYSGHGRSSGRFEDGTIGDWLEETRAVVSQLTCGPQIVVGSSTGGYIALLLLRELLRTDPNQARRISALVLIAPAWDLTEELMWKDADEAARCELMENGVYHRPSAYGEPYAITRNFVEEGRRHLFRAEPFDPGRPVVILQGAQDVDVPLAHARKLASFLTGGWAKLIEVADGEHRMSRPQDLALMFREIEKIIAAR